MIYKFNPYLFIRYIWKLDCIFCKEARVRFGWGIYCKFAVMPVVDRICKCMLSSKIYVTVLQWSKCFFVRYLTKDQLKSKSSVDAYISVFKRGCKCVERKFSLSNVLCTIHCFRHKYHVCIVIIFSKNVSFW